LALPDAIGPLSTRSLMLGMGEGLSTTIGSPFVLSIARLHGLIVVESDYPFDVRECRPFPWPVIAAERA
jgi:hypothetical protein